MLMWAWVLSAFVIASATLLIAAPVLLACFTFVLALLSQWRNRKQPNFGDSLESALYVGRVSHTRFRPVVHNFSYPLYWMAVDLAELDTVFQNKLWPLSWVMSFRDQDHFKNGEGMDILSPKQKVASRENMTRPSLAERTLTLVAQKTDGKFSPSLETHQVLLLTHLCYFGYCFNPVSFYYIRRKDSKQCEAIVAEVSNTPWNEMQCYVLHPDSIDMKCVVKSKEEDHQTNYVFPKTFHVSPFMEMDYLYDWTFGEFPTHQDALCIVTAMTTTTTTTTTTPRNHQKQDGRDEKKTTQFQANVVLHRKSLHPMHLSWQLIRFPIYCLWIQAWIHYEAFWLFAKGVAYQPHPEGSETTASRIIGNLMSPLFALKDWMNARKQQSTTRSNEKKET